ncbi:MAG TPA: Ni-sirohydrochlorin a,c-diamide reductive cyclase catalytic subunit [Methanospirillum sp.]|uniref:Ni-sirohydrochlorin a,c-diamide reductive cyclase catalytic subunit n=1 Tax=Methanospirillum sp. TaxID=45200 RepID=UPI002CACC6E4|nr:Ni-sirohydrochlorin a,c-diamide reductive cyclase catalytic subunit [Methanospirillum sp.]HWQ63580.1 Ni-sirohydrochlorin a,c-diamide reductive cyclase catalytic subunit [Methanospirillum sp.]
MKYMQPRPSSIVAALYTARDLGVTVSVLHGPSGCSFKHARLLEEDGMRVLTTSLSENEFVFGGQDRLIEVLNYAEKEFTPSRMAVVGTCVSLIIGEDLEAAIEMADLATETIAVDIHAGFPENIDGVIATLVPANRAGWISDEELLRQKDLLKKANEVERLRGAAMKSYITPSRGDLKHVAATRLMDLIREGKTGVAIMNAKKETAYMFADILLGLHDAAPDAHVIYSANLEMKGLPKVQRDADRISTELINRGLSFTSQGALDEYGATGDQLGSWIQNIKPDFALIVGVPHAIPAHYLERVECFSVTNGPRQVGPLKEQGHAHVMVEVDLHPRTLGVTSIVESEFGAVLRSLV